jgi:transposase
MAPKRTPLGPINSNKIRKKELTPYKRGQVIGASLFGHTPRVIAETLKEPESTVRTTLKSDAQRNEGESLPRTGRPQEWNTYHVRRLVRRVRQFPKLTYAQLRQELGWEFSDSTLKRMLEPSGIRNWRAKRRPHLSEAHAKKRLEWCKARRHWTLEQWRTYMWSDECSAERGKGKSAEWVFRTAEQKWDPKLVQTYKKSRDISVMVWACFWFVAGKIRRSDLYILDRD